MNESEPMARLSRADILIIHECLIAAVDGPFFPDWEFLLLMGVERDEVRHIAAEWPATQNAEVQDIAVTNVLNNLLGYPHGTWDSWPRYISVAPERVREILGRWLGAQMGPPPKGYFDLLR